MVSVSHIHFSQFSKHIGLIVGVVLVPIFIFLMMHHPKTKAYMLQIIKAIKRQADAGIMGRLYFVSFVIIMNLVFQDSTIPNLVSGYIFGLGEGVVLTSVGCSLSGIVSFYLSKYKFKDEVNEMIQDYPALKQLQDSEDDFTDMDWFELVALSRLPPIYPYHMISYFWGTTKVNPLMYVTASFLGSLPSVTLETYIGSSMTSLEDFGSSHKKPYHIIVIIVISILVSIGIGYKAESIIKDHKRLKQTSPSPLPKQT